MAASTFKFVSGFSEDFTSCLDQKSKILCSVWCTGISIWYLKKKNSFILIDKNLVKKIQIVILSDKIWIKHHLDRPMNIEELDLLYWNLFLRNYFPFIIQCNIVSIIPPLNYVCISLSVNVFCLDTFFLYCDRDCALDWLSFIYCPY